mgnify:CR=1 FL=1
MRAASRKGKDNGNAQQHEGSLPGGDKPVVVERGKKFAAYDKFGKLIILGYNRRIVERYANDQRILRSKQQRKD